MKKLVQLIVMGFLNLLIFAPINAQAPVEIEGVGDQGIKMTQAGSATVWNAAVTSLGSTVGNITNTRMDFTTNNLPRMTINNNGKIGVGITSPQRLFHVSEPGTSGGPLTEVMMLQSSLSKRPTLVFSEDGQGAMSIEYDGRLLGDDNKININDNDENPQFTFTMGGAMGIGTIDPIAPIHIVNEGIVNVPTTCLLLESNTSNRPRISFSESFNGVEAMSLEYDGNGGGTTNRMHITGINSEPIATFLRSSKDVGIGTTTPEQPLHVKGAVTGEGLRITRTNSSVDLDAFTDLVAGHVGTTTDHSLKLLTNNATRLTIMNNGNVGIGTSLPTAKLQVNGTISGTQVICSGTSLCSDARFKKDIRPMESSMNKLMQLQGVNYFWDREKFKEKGFGDEKQIGFVAQDIQKVFPELVHVDPEGYLSVDYTSLVPVLVEALKQQQDEFNTFKNQTNKRILNLEKEINQALRRKK